MNRKGKVYGIVCKDYRPMFRNSQIAISEAVRWLEELIEEEETKEEEENTSETNASEVLDNTSIPEEELTPISYFFNPVIF